MGWSEFERRHPRLSEILDWAVLLLSLVAFVLALAVYLRGA